MGSTYSGHLRRLFPLFSVFMLGIWGGPSHASHSTRHTTDLDQDGLLEYTSTCIENGVLSVRDESGRILAETEAVAMDQLSFSDANGDGWPDLLLAGELLIDNRELRPALFSGGDAPARGFANDFVEVWNSGQDLDNVWEVEIGDFDQDGLPEIITHSYHYPGSSILAYECVGDNDFELVWESEIMSINAFTALCVADSDQDGNQEILAGEAGFNGDLYLWEQNGEGAPLRLTLEESMGYQVRGIVSCDLDQDGNLEYCIAAGDAVAGSSVRLLEHSGEIGENVYDAVFTYAGSEYITGLAVGDSDNDGREEIILTLGGFIGDEMLLRRFEYDSELGVFESRITYLGIPRPALCVAVGDLNGNGQNELIIGSEGIVFIMHSVADEEYTFTWASSFDLAGAVLDIALGPLNDEGNPMFCIGSSLGQAEIMGYEDGVFARYPEGSIDGGQQIRSIMFGLFDVPDTTEDLIFSRSFIDVVSMYEPAVLTAADWPVFGDELDLSVGRNPFQGVTELIFSAPEGIELALDIFDVRGRLLRSLELDGARGVAHWDGRDATGSPQAAGVYLARLATENSVRSSRLVLLR